MLEEERPKSMSDAQLDEMSKDELVKLFKQLDKYRLGIEEREKKNLMELTKLKNIILMNYVTTKEIELSVISNYTFCLI